MNLDFNKTKQGIDVSDQLSSYFNPQWKSLVGHKKVVMELPGPARALMGPRADYFRAPSLIYTYFTEIYIAV